MEDFGDVVDQLGKHLFDMECVFATGAIGSSDTAKQYVMLKDNCYTVLLDLKTTLQENGLLDQSKYDVLSQLIPVLKDKDAFSFIVIKNVFEILSQSSYPLQKRFLPPTPVELEQSPVAVSQNLLSEQASEEQQEVASENPQPSLATKYVSITSSIAGKSIALWREVFSLFDIKLDYNTCIHMSTRMCRDVMDAIDWRKYTNEHLSIILSTLQSALEQPTWQDFSGISSLKLLIKEVQEILKEKCELIADQKQQLEFLEKRKLLSKTFVPLKHSIGNFVEGIASSVEKIGDISFYDTWESIETDTIVYQKIMSLYAIFLNDYSIYIANVGACVLKDFTVKDISLGAILKTQLRDLDHVYSEMSLDRFFLAIKQGYLLGDMYDFLLAIQKHIPEISYADSSLQQRLDAYSS